MVVEFDCVRCSNKEMYDRDVAEDKKLYDVPFEHSDDYLGKISVDMRTVVDFAQGRIYFNDEMYECIYVRTNQNEAIPNLLIPYKDFKRIYEKARNIEIKKASEL